MKSLGFPWRKTEAGCLKQKRRPEEGRLERRAGFEPGVLRRGDLDLFAGGGVTAFAGFALAHREGAEADQAHFVAFFESLFDAADRRFERGCRSHLRQAGFRRDVFDEFNFIHGPVSSSAARAPHRHEQTIETGRKVGRIKPLCRGTLANLREKRKTSPRFSPELRGFLRGGASPAGSRRRGSRAWERRVDRDASRSTRLGVSAR